MSQIVKQTIKVRSGNGFRYSIIFNLPAEDIFVERAHRFGIVGRFVRSCLCQNARADAIVGNGNSELQNRKA